MSGGGSLLRGIDTVIADAIGIPVRVVDDPITCVVRGTGILLEDQPLLEQVSLPSAQEDKIKN